MVKIRSCKRIHEIYHTETVSLEKYYQCKYCKKCFKETKVPQPPLENEGLP